MWDRLSSLALLRDGVLDREETLATVDRMIDAGWHCSTDLYARTRDRIDDLAERCAPTVFGVGD